LSLAPLRHCFVRGIGEVGAGPWNAIAPEYPFLRHEFLHALEASGCAAPATGWSPHHLLMYRGERLVAAAPLYEKAHSWGEFVFDFAWARAFDERGLPYYPKLLLAIPFTPATGPRLLCAPDEDAAALQRAALAAIEAEACAHRRSNAHALFMDESLRAQSEQAGWLLRSDCHFQWHNRGYASHEDFIATFSADKRKKARRERRRVAEQGITFRTVRGHELDEALLRKVHGFHANTFIAHGHLPYLNLHCLREMAAGLGERMIVKLAVQRDTPVAAAVFFSSSDTLYGRYWGADGEYHSLHFEACYYQGIDLCIESGLQRFEPGTQGEHKLARGFEPVLTWSAHWIGDRTLRSAIAAYLRREQHAVRHYAADAAEHLPFRSGAGPEAP
jgi:predicted N-acyltransferase